MRQGSDADRRTLAKSYAGGAAVLLLRTREGTSGLHRLLHATLPEAHEASERADFLQGSRAGIWREMIINGLRLWIQLDGERCYIEVICDICHECVSSGFLQTGYAFQTFMEYAKKHEHAKVSV